MASFDWRGFLDLALRLSSEKDEASLRTAISRGYYFVYHLALSRAEQNSYKPPKERGSHIDLWRVYTASPIPDCIQLGTIGTKMMRLRIEADYRQNFPRLNDALPDVLIDARKFADLLAKLDPRHPNQSSQRR